MAYDSARVKIYESISQIVRYFTGMLRRNYLQTYQNQRGNEVAMSAFADVHTYADAHASAFAHAHAYAYAYAHAYDAL